MRAAVVLILALLASGCSRAFYRRSADRESYHAIRERTCDPQWQLPSIGITPPPGSRLYDPFDPDFPPMPPDDPAAHRYMHCANGMPGYRHWHKYGDAPWIEDPEWRDFLQLSDKGELVLTPERAVDIGLLDSREYQTAREDLYESALALTLNRYDFALHWFARNNTFFTHFGSSADESNTLTTNSEAGFQRNLAAGGQLLVDFANSWVFEFAGPDHTTVTSNILITLMQPLLRRFGRDVRMEQLTQGERSLLYAVRDFARFRKLFWFDVTTQSGTGFLSLLFQVQNIRNLRANLAAQEENLRLHEALFTNGSVSTIQVDQAFTSYQQSRLQLLQAQTSLETALDNYKTTLGLPPDVPVQLDDSLLAPFQLAAPELTQMQDDLGAFFASYRELDQAPSLPSLQAGFARLKTYPGRTVKVIEQAADEIGRWRKQLDEPGEDKERVARDRATLQVLAKQLAELRADTEQLARDIAKAEAALAEDRRQQGWDALQKWTRQQIAIADELFVVQNQVRVFLIQLKPVKYEQGWAIQFALTRRLDLMNARGRVVDAWRQIWVTANALKADLDVVASANIATPPDGNNPVGFRASASTYKVGFQFDSPLNRELERNNYRLSLINYERSRRGFMALEDNVAKAVRRDLRNLETDRLNFEIARLTLVSAARQVEASRERLLLIEKAADTTTTQDILTALSALLTAKNALIGSWVSYETDRTQLLLDMELLQLDARGIPLDESDCQPEQPSPGGNPDRPSPAGRDAAADQAAP